MNPKRSRNESATASSGNFESHPAGSGLRRFWRRMPDGPGGRGPRSIASGGAGRTGLSGSRVRAVSDARHGRRRASAGVAVGRRRRVFSDDDVRLSQRRRLQALHHVRRHRGARARRVRRYEGARRGLSDLSRGRHDGAGSRTDARGGPFLQCGDPPGADRRGRARSGRQLRGVPARSASGTWRILPRAPDDWPKRPTTA